MRKPAILITGANGEMGHGLITALHQKNNTNFVALDLNPLEASISGFAACFLFKSRYVLVGQRDLFFVVFLPFNCYLTHAG